MKNTPLGRLKSTLAKKLHPTHWACRPYTVKNLAFSRDLGIKWLKMHPKRCETPNVNDQTGSKWYLWRNTVPPRLRGRTVLRPQRRFVGVVSLIGAPARPSEPPPCAVLSRLASSTPRKAIRQHNHRLACARYIVSGQNYNSWWASRAPTIFLKSIFVQALLPPM